MDKNTQHTPGWFTAEQERAALAAYENELLRRFDAGLLKNKADIKEARRVKRARAAIAKAEGRS